MSIIIDIKNDLKESIKNKSKNKKDNLRVILGEIQRDKHKNPSIDFIDKM